MKYVAIHNNTGGSAESLIYIVWCAISMLYMIDLQVISVVADGGSNNRRFFSYINYPNFKHLV